MPTVKFDKAVKIVAGKPIPDELIKSGLVKLPFTATGMKVEKNQDIIDRLGYSTPSQANVDIVKEIEVKAEVVEDVKPKKKAKRGGF